MAANYAREKFVTGLYKLAEGNEGVRQRLLEAYVEQVSHAHRISSCHGRSSSASRLCING